MQIESLHDPIYGEWCPECEEPALTVRGVAFYPPLHHHRMTECLACHARTNECVGLDGDFHVLPWTESGGVACVFAT